MELGIATTNVGGAGAWLPQYIDTLTGSKQVAILAHNDEAGRAHAVRVADDLTGKVGELRVYLPKTGNDVADHIRTRHPVKEMVLVDEVIWRTWCNGRDPQTPPNRRLSVIKDSDVERKPVTWLWPGWLPLRKLVALDGDPDTGKSTMSVDLAARVSRGGLMPDGSQGLGGEVILLSGDIDDTTSWRLGAAGADRDRIRHVQATLDGSGESPVVVPQDLDLLEALIEEYHAVLVVIDVLAEYMDSGVDTHRDHSVRQALHLLRGVASRTNSAIVFLRHLRKAAAEKAIHAGGGSVGIIGAARAGWVVAYHPTDEGLRVLASSKMNLGQKPTPLGFRLLTPRRIPLRLFEVGGPGEHRGRRPAQSTTEAHRQRATGRPGEGVQGRVLRADHDGLADAER
jgi:hypothetical protein